LNEQVRTVFEHPGERPQWVVYRFRHDPEREDRERREALADLPSLVASIRERERA
jgi:hypothetical protein